MPNSSASRKRGTSSAVRSKEELATLPHAVDHLAAAVDRLAHVDAQGVVSDAELLGVAEEVDQLGVPEEGLAGDAAPVQAEGAHAVLLDQDRLQAEVGGADGGDVATRPAAHDAAGGLGP